MNAAIILCLLPLAGIALAEPVEMPELPPEEWANTEYFKMVEEVREYHRNGGSKICGKTPSSYDKLASFCGGSSVFRVADGCEARHIRDFPYMVKMQVDNDEYPMYGSEHGGVILSDRVIATSNIGGQRHGFNWTFVNHDPNVRIRITVGTADWWNEKHTFETTLVNMENHPGMGTDPLKHLYTLLRLDEPIDFRKYGSAAAPICLPEAKANPQGVARCIVAGYGLERQMTEEEEEAEKEQELVQTEPNKLRYVPLEVIQFDECHRRFGYMPSTGICAAGRGATRTEGGNVLEFEEELAGSCWGDNGGPLACERNDGRWVLRGIIEDTWACGNKKYGDDREAIYEHFPDAYGLIATPEEFMRTFGEDPAEYVDNINFDPSAWQPGINAMSCTYNTYRKEYDEPQEEEVEVSLQIDEVPEGEEGTPVTMSLAGKSQRCVAAQGGWCDIELEPLACPNLIHSDVLTVSKYGCCHNQKCMLVPGFGYHVCVFNEFGSLVPPPPPEEEELEEQAEEDNPSAHLEDVRLLLEVKLEEVLPMLCSFLL